ncbi:hypothetical protein B0H11DRAFT_2260287 [Mycena galericulata]|nr:hypothetical protein B0H11DRAFT_2260287 [Mycena galericulata]
MVKVNDRYEFPFEIDLGEFLNSSVGRSKSWVYNLYGVVVHSGDLDGGHYSAFIKPDRDTPWLRFDDGRVTPATDKQVLEESYGGNWFETLTYGMYLVTCGFCARTLLCIGPEDRWRRPSEVRWLILSVSIALFMVATFDVILGDLGLLHNLQAFAFYTGGGGAVQELSDISGWINVTKTAAHVAQMILGDFVLANIQVGCLSPLRRISIDVALIRCYIVYSRHWKVLIPSLILYFGGVAIGIKLVEAQASLNHAEITVISSDIRPWSETFFCITAVQNTLTTGLLIWRIWRVEREIEEFRMSASGTRNNHSPLRKVIRVIAESGFAYTLMVFLTFLVDLCNTNLVYCFADATHQATAIAFNVVIM